MSRTEVGMSDDLDLGDGPAPLGADSGRGGRVSGLVRDAPAWTGVTTLLVLIILGLSFGNDLFLTFTNLTNIARGLAIPLLLATGATLLLTTGMIDLSIGSMLALCTMVAAGLFSLDVPSWLVVIGTVLAGSLFGAINGFFVAKVGLSFFVVTLGTLAIYRSAAQLPTDGLSVALSNEPGFDLISWLGDGKVGVIAVPVVIAVGAVLIFAAVVRWTNFGRQLYAVGGNEAAARLSGIRVDRVRIAVFAVNGLLVGVASVIFMGRIQAGSPLIGVGVELSVVAAVLLGGTSFSGGQSSLFGTTMGVVFIAVLQNGLDLVGVQALWQGVITGTVLILAVWIDRIRRRGAA